MQRGGAVDATGGAALIRGITRQISSEISSAGGFANWNKMCFWSGKRKLKRLAKQTNHDKRSVSDKLKEKLDVGDRTFTKVLLLQKSRRK